MSYFIQYFDRIALLFLEHLWLSAAAVAFSLIVAIPLSWFLYDHPKLVQPVIGALGILYTIPSIALIILLVPVFGLNSISVFFALVIYCQILLARNILSGLKSIPASIQEAAIGLGMNRRQIALQVELPLSLPVLLAGIRIAALVAISITSIGAKFGAGGLGELLFEGISQYRYDKLWIGTISIAILAFGVNSALKQLEARFSSQIYPN
jgi:osmoprotectant transport system permease protein